MKLIIGLGNPEKKYDSTRHNIGHRIINTIVAQKKLTLKSYPKLSAHLAEYCTGGPLCPPSSKILIGITDQYMNNSGISLKKIADYFKIQPSEILIVHDDLDLAVGEWRLQFDRGAAGHNGIKSTIQHLGTQAFHRLRVGIDHPRNSPNPNLPVGDYVLLPFSPNDLVIINQTIDKIVQDFDKIIA